MFSIKNEALRNFIVGNSSWVIKGACVALKEWKEGTIAHKIDFSAVNFWVQNFNLLLEYTNKRNGMVLGKKLGCTLQAVMIIFTSMISELFCLSR